MTTPTPPPAVAAANIWIRKHKVLTALIALFVVGIIGSAFSGGSEDKTDTVDTGSASTPTPTPTVSPTPSPAAKPVDVNKTFRDRVEDHLPSGDKLEAVKLTKRPDGSYDVKAVLVAHEAFSGKNAPKAVHEAAYHLMFAAHARSKMPIHAVTADVKYTLVDAEGNESVRVVYTGILSAAVGARLNTSSEDKFYTINWDAIVVDEYEHPAVAND